MKRRIALLAGLILLPVVGAVPAARGGVATCTITGTIHFVPPAATATRGEWRIVPGAIRCYGTHTGPEYFLGQGPFSGSGSYTVLSAGPGACLHQVGEGIVEYEIPTSGPNPTFSVKEPHEFVMAGAGTFATPSLRGSFTVAPDEGDCVSKPVTRATFIAQAVFLRDVP